ncbi:MAG TPA: arylsulfatase, partial [Verrucomicrobiae bacterium]|nr:arylsulfatase [Verrucomicrobiae bacterium]
WHLVSVDGGRDPHWQLYDVAKDYAEMTDVKDQHNDVVRDLARRFDVWWDSVLPALVNEKAVGPRVNPFKEKYWGQFGGGPSAEDLRLMDPASIK